MNSQTLYYRNSPFPPTNRELIPYYAGSNSPNKNALFFRNLLRQADEITWSFDVEG